MNVIKRLMFPPKKEKDGDERDEKVNCSNCGKPYKAQTIDSNLCHDCHNEFMDDLFRKEDI